MLGKITSFADVHRVLDDQRQSTKRHSYSLDHMFELLECLGNPQQRLRVIHVAGTSGKTSTAYYIAALLQACGKQVGLTISPHVDEINERVQLDLIPLPEAQFASRFGEFMNIVEHSGVVPNYFELCIAFAFWEFAARKVDYVVVEVGIGGLLDSSNVFVGPDKVCVITDIGYDHQRILGNTLSEIAEQKAGIIQLHNPIFCYQQAKEVDEAIRKVAKQKQADLHVLSHTDDSFDVDFLPLFEQRNFGLAFAAAQFVIQRDMLPPLNQVAIQHAAHTYIPARMEVQHLQDKTFVLDVAHNGQKMHALLQSMQARFGDTPVAALVRLSSSKERSQRLVDTLEELTKSVTHLIVTSIADEGKGPDRSFNPEQISKACKELGFTAFEIIADPEQALTTLQQRPEPLLLVAGSFPLVSKVRLLMKSDTRG